ncbi:MAG: hypothetical protein WCO56_26140 [Verrucomicrobiota bacterium]
MTEPLALLVYERLLPGSQLLNRLEDLHYRVQTLSEPAQMTELAAREKPMLALMDMVAKNQDAGAAITRLRNTPETRHIPVIAIVPAGDSALEKEARVAGATLVANDQAILIHLAPLLDQALQVD